MRIDKVSRHDHVQQTKTFGIEFGAEDIDAGQVTTGPAQARNEAWCYWDRWLVRPVNDNL